MLTAAFAIHGAIETATGGYAYARAVIAAGREVGLDLDLVTLPAGFPQPSPRDLDAVRAILADQRAGRPVLLDGLAGGALPDALIRACPAPVVMLCHHPLAREAGLTDDQAHALYTSERAALAAVSSVIVTSDATGGILQAEYGVEAERLVVARPGTVAMPRAHGSSGCEIISVGSFTPRKRHAMLIDALASCRDLPWSARIIGAEPDPAARPALSDRISGLGLSERIRLQGSCPRSSLDAAYAGSDLFVLASEYEGYGMAFTEAMAHGLPVLGIQSGAVAEATGGGANLVGDDAFAQALRTMISDPETRRSWADRAWTAAGTFPRWSDTAAILRATLAEVAA